MSTKKDDIGVGVAIGVFLLTSGFFLVIIFCGLGAWGSFAAIVVSFPATEDPDCDHTPRCDWVLLASTTKFHTDDIRLKQWKGGSVSVYVDQHKFEAIPFPDRDGVLQPIVKGWCEYHSGPLIPSVWFTDIRTGSFLMRYGCFSIAMSRLWDEVSQSKKKPNGTSSLGKR